MNLSKETKQKISLNYSIAKNKDAIQNFINLHNEKTLNVMNRILFICNFDEAKITHFISLVNKVNYKKITDDSNYYLVNMSPCQLNFNCIKYIKDININVFNTNMVYFYQNKPTKYDIPEHLKHFNFQSLILNNKELIKKDEKINELVKEYLELETELKESLQTSYDNLYLLIKNIRTLDRIEKQFPDVINYLPTEIVHNSDPDDIKSKFDNL